MSIGVLTNMGNYKGFGDSKMVPDLTPEKVIKNTEISQEYCTGHEIK